jgi:hypothetical protein
LHPDRKSLLNREARRFWRCQMNANDELHSPQSAHSHDGEWQTGEADALDSEAQTPAGRSSNSSVHWDEFDDGDDFVFEMPEDVRFVRRILRRRLQDDE